MEIYETRTAATGGWLLLRLRQPRPNPDAVGAWVEVETAAGLQSREVTVGGGHAGGDSGFLHFGLGDATGARVRVIWPDGAASDWRDAAANTRLSLARNGDRLAIGMIR
ncbi:MAG: ASPIC/UnbV domain-containing protein [Pseudomonadota bacterium]